MEKPRAAWIDHCGGINVLFAMELRQRGIELAAASTLEQFLERHDLQTFPVLFYHPAIQEQHKFFEVQKQYPNTIVALITAPCSDGDYKQFRNADIPVFTYDVDSVERFVREHQGQTASPIWGGRKEE
jgi:hypothetical protein